MSDHPTLSTAAVQQLVGHIQAVCAQRPDLRREKYVADEDPHPLAGHCYVATEALYHLVGGTDSEYTPCRTTHEDVTHWFLRHADVELGDIDSDAEQPPAEIIDITAAQFDTPVAYTEARGGGFLTGEPSARAATVISMVTARLASDTESGLPTPVPMRSPEDTGAESEALRPSATSSDEDAA
jgi:hypothetical protein